jgi:hypothetical protein
MVRIHFTACLEALGARNLVTARSVIVARVSQVKIAVTLFLFFATIALVCSQFWGDPPTSWFISHPHYDRSHWEWRKAVVWIGAAILLLLGLCGVRQWWRYGGAYVIIKNGVVQGYFGATPLQEIKDISLGYRKLGVRQRVILLTLRNGGELTIPLWALTEPGPVILARLQGAIQESRAS